MKLERLTLKQIDALIDELRAMADLPPGSNPVALGRARAIRFQLQGQDAVTSTGHEKADEAYRDLEILLHAHRWRDEHSLDYLRKRIKSSCERLRVYAGSASRPSA